MGGKKPTTPASVDPPSAAPLGADAYAGIHYLLVCSTVDLFFSLPSGSSPSGISEVGSLCRSSSWFLPAERQGLSYLSILDKGVTVSSHKLKANSQHVCRNHKRSQTAYCLNYLIVSLVQKERVVPFT